MFLELGFDIMSRVYTSAPKVDQRAFGSSDDLNELLSVVSCSSTFVTDPAAAGYADHVRNIDGSNRLFSAQNKIYLLPLDDEEFRRLDKQHSLLRIGMTGLYPARGLVDPIFARHKQGNETMILDIGCGSAQWGLDLVSECEHISLTCIDLVQIEEKLPSNIQFIRHDVNTGLRDFYQKYDIVHIRCVASGIKSYRKLLQEAGKCLKPGGIALFIEGDFDLFAENQQVIQEPASDANPDGSYLQRWMQAVRMAQVKRCNITDSDDCPETLDKGLWQFEQYDPSTCGVGSIFTPTSPWIKSNMEEEAIHFKVAGVLMRQNLKMFLEATEQMLIENGIKPEDISEWKTKAREEMDGTGHPRTGSWFRWRVAWGCAPALPLDANPDDDPLNPPRNPDARPTMIWGRNTRAAREFLLSKVEHFKYKQLHVYNQREALAKLGLRLATPFSTRGRF